jgi:hypothetical protein
MKVALDSDELTAIPRPPKRSAIVLTHAVCSVIDFSQPPVACTMVPTNQYGAISTKVHRRSWD